MACRAAVIGGNRRFREFLDACGAELDFFDGFDDALSSQNWDALIILPCENRETVSQASLDRIKQLASFKQGGKRIYAEMYMAYNMYQASVFGCEVLGKPNHVTGQALCAAGELRYQLDGWEIMQATGCAYLPAKERLLDTSSKNAEVLLKLGSYVGTVHPVKRDVQTYPMLIRSGSVYTSLLALSSFDRLDMHPYLRWKQLYGWLFSELLGCEQDCVQKAFERVYPPVSTRYDINVHLPENNFRECCERALSDAVKWHFDSGVILPGNGETGSVEMIMSNTHELYNNRRVDAGMYTGWLLYAAGRYFVNSEWTDKGRRIFDFFAANGQIDGGTKDGLYKWYFNEYAFPRKVYSIDAGRCGIALLNMYMLTRDKSLFGRIVRLADAFCRWEKGGLFTAPSTDYDPSQEDTAFEGDGACTASIYAEDCVFLAYVWKLTGEGRYLDTLCAIVDRLTDAYPNYIYYGHTTSSRNARLLTAMLAVRRTGKRKYTELINRMIDYLAALQLPCGGIYSEDNLSFEHFGDEKNNTIGENGISVPWEEEKMSDQLYCVNNVLMALSLMRGLEDADDLHLDKALRLRSGLIEYVLKIQITDEDKRLHGGWMRAFDMTLNEYYGMDLDKYWGAYCIMAGWTMGIIPLALLEELTGECFYAPKIDSEPKE